MKTLFNLIKLPFLFIVLIFKALDLGVFLLEETIRGMKGEVPEDD